MRKHICPQLASVFEHLTTSSQVTTDSAGGFVNSDSALLEQAEAVQQQRVELGLEGLVGNLACVVINTERDRQDAAVQELLDGTGFHLTAAFENEQLRTAVLAADGSPNILVQSRTTDGPFHSETPCPKADHLPNTRLETFVFEAMDLQRYVAIQRDQGVRFLTNDFIETEHFRFIQTIPSSFSQISYGYIEWKTGVHNYASCESRPIELTCVKRDNPMLTNIGVLDHTATRVEARDRDAAIVEFMMLTNHNFKFSVYVKQFNSITNVARRAEGDFAMVFTSGIRPYIDDTQSGPTEKFIHNYGPRVHHMAFRTEAIETTYESLVDGGMEFLIGLVGDEAEGLRQTFSKPSPNTLLVNEYIHRYGDFDGFFTAGNVTLLTGATDKQ